MSAHLTNQQAKRVGCEGCDIEECDIEECEIEECDTEECDTEEMRVSRHCCARGEVSKADKTSIQRCAYYRANS